MNEFYNKMKYFKETEKIPVQIFYHYTSLEALYNIVSSKTFRLTSLKSSNDAKELYYKPENFINDFKEIIDKENDEITKRCFRLIKESVELHEEEFIKGCKEKTYPYAICLSEKRDNLTHWDRYASSCTGVCIGINVSALRVLMQRMAITAFGIGIYDVGKVLYATEQKERFIRNSLVTIANAINKQEDVKSSNIEELLRKGGYVYATSAYLQVAKFVKDNSFVDEDEVRLYHDSASIKGTMHLIELMKNDIEPELYENLKKHFNEFVYQLCLTEESFYMSSKGIRSYKELCLDAVWGSGTIPEIILGPMCIQNRKELKHFLKANGLEGTKISVSSVPIR